MAGIYLHIPFCKQACYYCDFHFSTNLSYREKMVDAIAAEIALQRDYLNGAPIDTIYFGGGTPSLLSTPSIARLIDTIATFHKVGEKAEVTLEANPDDLSKMKLYELRNIGVNRLSIGIQAFDDSILKMLNRAHDGATARQCLADVRAAGFENFNVDLIYAIPGQSLAQWTEEVDFMLAFKPPHISAYTLTIEERTVFGKHAAQGILTPVPDDFAAIAMEQLVHRLTESGYQHYEISNFAIPGFASRHNSHYWTGVAYLGVGPSAHSYNGRSRQFNATNNHGYLAAIQQGSVPATIENLSREDLINEYLLTRLRTSWGVDLKTLVVDFQFDLLVTRGPYLRELVERQLAVLDDHVIRLTPAGMRIADKIAADLFVISS